MLKAVDLAKELNLYVKLVTSSGNFENYNSFFNVYSELEEYVRRVVVITPYKDLEEVVEEDSSKAINTEKLIDGNLWIKEYSLLTVPSTIDINSICVTEKQAEILRKEYA
ncbi:hypothetical protein SAMN04487886_103415 [Clostridium sp. DSM 8431]|uniref:hypothetical protein n=1 Tax=Clostridium sp. DSM 8431 TaxID=1761781 RepID=UPI0008F06A71|nr:hypothetical protein [Clostridium sp. DSM 8431]SFU46559.1 hypothetical protein SAMN04487886_103415 [Clostridium sp. DSM 8431]